MSRVKWVVPITKLLVLFGVKYADHTPHFHLSNVFEFQRMAVEGNYKEMV